MMHIQIDAPSFKSLTAWHILSGGMEYSGLGLIERDAKILNVVGVDLLNIGSWGYTEIPAHRQRALPLDERRKLWYHRHPVGKAEPGPGNWSGTDHYTAAKNPLGGVPELVQWSCSMVYTPTGWTGRLDVYLPVLQTYYIPVYPTVPTAEQLEEAKECLTPELLAYGEELRAEFRKMPNMRISEDWDLEDDDIVKPRTPYRKRYKRSEKPVIFVNNKNIFTRYYEEMDLK